MRLGPPGHRARIAGACLGVAVAFVALAACTDATCRGTVVDGECQETCVDSACEDDAQCLDNRCTKRCSSDEDCDPGKCERREADDGNRVGFCFDDVADDDGPDGGFTPQCLDSEDCGSDRTQHCVAGVCRLTCELHEHCGEAGSCSMDAQDEEGRNVTLCEPDDFSRGEGAYGTRCPSGNVDCAEGFRCVSAGEGDANAYCTQTGCDVDDDCPTGFFCSFNRTTQPPCSAACGLPGSPGTPNCIPADAIGAGEAFRCADDGELELRICLRREYCSECETDADCRSLPDQVCAEGGDGGKICTVLCDPTTNSCPWGSASSCDVWDERLGLPTCGHRSLACRQNGDSCDPCLDDRDCPLGFCSQNAFTGEQFCVDESATCSCPSGEAQCIGGGCPTTPSGLSMNCVARAQGAAPDACFGAPTIEGDPSSPLGCWPREAQSL